MAAMLVAALAVYPLGLIGWQGAAGIAFIIAMLVAIVAATADFIVRLWRG